MKNINNGSKRLIIVPKPSTYGTIKDKYTFGFMHPSNIVKEGKYFYMFLLL